METPSVTRVIIGASVVLTAYSAFDPSILRFGMDPFMVGHESVAATAARVVLFQFLHGSPLHLLSNALFLWYFGTGIEKNMGWKRYAAFFAFSTVLVAGMIILFASGNTIGVSGFAMAVLTYQALRMKEARNPEYRGALFFVALNVAFGLFGNVSLVGHLAGAFAGGIFRWGERS